MARPVLSLVLPIYNEEEVLPELHTQLQDFLGRLNLDCEVIFVNDGSSDLSLQILRGIASAEPRYRILSFARNFGHQTAITAGMDYASGQAVVVMDADLQDPPEVVLEMVQKWREGYDVVYGQRTSRIGETAFKVFSARIFYRLFRALIPIDVPLDTGDFRLMSRRVVVALRALRESHRFVRGMVSWVGFKHTSVLYDRPARFAGETKYPLRKMLRFAVDGITSFSVVPLRFATYLGFSISIVSVIVAMWATIAHFGFESTVPGWTAQVVIVSLLASVQLVMIGILGEYIGRIYEQVKLRPLYVVGDKVNLYERDDDELDPAPPMPMFDPQMAAPKLQTMIGVAPPSAPPPPTQTAAMPAIPGPAKTVSYPAPPQAKTAPMPVVKREPSSAEVREEDTETIELQRPTTQSFPPPVPPNLGTAGPPSVPPRASNPPNSPGPISSASPNSSGPASRPTAPKAPSSKPKASNPPPLPKKG